LPEGGRKGPHHPSYRQRKLAPEQKLRGKDKPTNVLSFAQRTTRSLGESHGLWTVRREARAQKKPAVMRRILPCTGRFTFSATITKNRTRPADGALEIELLATWASPILMRPVLYEEAQAS